VGREDCLDVGVGRGDSLDGGVGREVCLEVVLGREVCLEVVLGREVCLYVGVGRGDCLDDGVGRGDCREGHDHMALGKLEFAVLSIVAIWLEVTGMFPTGLLKLGLLMIAAEDKDAAPGVRVDTVGCT
jgi:hypothetical protein